MAKDDLLAICSTDQLPYNIDNHISAYIGMGLGTQASRVRGDRVHAPAMAAWEHDHAKLILGRSGEDVWLTLIRLTNWPVQGDHQHPRVTQSPDRPVHDRSRFGITVIKFLQLSG